MRKTKLITATVLFGLCLFFIPAQGQIFSDYRWDQKTIIMGKYSPLFYELNIGVNVTPDSYSADFLYFSVGYGKPSATNEWHKYLDKKQSGDAPSQPSQPSQPSGPSGQSGPSGPSSGGGNPSSGGDIPTQPSAPSAPTGSMSDLHGGQLSIGWQHYFNHSFGFHLQAGWGFVADFGSDEAPQPTSTSSNNSKDEVKSMYIYNGVPVQAGIDLSLWENLIIGVGATYMWKDLPVVTVGIGITF